MCISNYERVVSAIESAMIDHDVACIPYDETLYLDTDTLKIVTSQGYYDGYVYMTTLYGSTVRDVVDAYISTCSGCVMSELAYVLDTDVAALSAAAGITADDDMADMIDKVSAYIRDDETRIDKVAAAYKAWLTEDNGAYYDAAVIAVNECGYDIC